MKKKVVITLLLVTVLTAFSIFFFSPAKKVHPTKYNYHDVLIKKEDDSGKSGKMRSRIVWLPMYQEPKTGGESKDTWRIFFDAPVDVRGVLVSIDHTSFSIKLAELAVQISNPKGYVQSPTHDALIHTSYVRGIGSRRTDEHVFFPPGSFILNTDDYLSIGSYLTNRSSFKKDGIHPEIIVYYEWIDK